MLGRSALIAWPILAVSALAAAETMAQGANDAAIQKLVRADWELQEQRLGRAVHAPETIRDRLQRIRMLLEDQQTAGTSQHLASHLNQIDRFSAAMTRLASMDEDSQTALYFEVRALGREVALDNPLVNTSPIVFMQRRRAVGYMLYEYLGWYYAFGNDPTSGFKNPKFPTPRPGGGVFVLEQPGRSFKTRELTAGKFPPGHFVTLSLSFDARTIYFAYADPRGADCYTLPGYAKAPPETNTKYNTFHIFAMNADGSNLRQLTDGPFDDFDPCPLPDGGIAFMSTRRGGKLRCGGGSPEIVYTLHRMDSDGRNIRTLSFHETHEWHPAVLNDGRIIYTRWDYVDRNAAKFHGLWTCNPDGTSPAILFGNYTTRPWASFQAKAIPNSSKIAFIAGGHHANVGGTLMLLDPSRLAYDNDSGEDRLESLQRLTPDVLFAEKEGWPRSFFYSPWPLSEKHFLVAFSHDPLPGGYTGQHRDSQTSLYYFDSFGNLELLFRGDDISAVYPIPLRERSVAPVRAGQVDPDLGESGEFFLADVRRSVLTLPPSRRITHLRIFQLLPKSRTDSANYPRMGHPDQANARMLLGTVPVEEDGSAYFTAPARKPLYFQAVDAAGRAVQGMRTIAYLQPGERRSCVGCHEPPGAVAGPQKIFAARRSPSPIEPGPDGTLPFSYTRLIQPILDRHCVRCHDGSAGPEKSAPVLTGQITGPFSKSYDQLKPYLRWPSYDQVTRPGQLGADASPLSAILIGESHRRYVKLTDADLRSFYLWLDAHVPFYGTYEEKDLDAQRRGLAISPPAFQ